MAIFGAIAGAISTVANKISDRNGGKLFANDDKGIFGGAIKQGINNIIGGGSTGSQPQDVQKSALDSVQMPRQKQRIVWNDKTKVWYKRPLTWLIAGIGTVGTIVTILIVKSKKKPKFRR